MSSGIKTSTYPIIGGQTISEPPPAVALVADFPRDASSFDTDAFDNAIFSHGVQFLHYRAMRCPIGLATTTDIRKMHDNHPGCSHGFLYTLGGQITAIFTGNNAVDRQTTGGLVGDGVAQVTTPRFYDSTQTPFYATKYDRLYLTEPGIFVTNWEVFECSITGKDRCSFPVEYVVDLVDSDGNRYAQNVDFTIDHGMIVWDDRRRPKGPIPGDGGVVCGIRYLYRPYWYVTQLMHEVRVARGEMPDGTSRVQRMPMSLAIQREYLFESESAPVEGDALSPPVTPRQAPAPRVGTFSPR
jgi:hypothetical protein